MVFSFSSWLLLTIFFVDVVFAQQNSPWNQNQNQNFQSNTINSGRNQKFPNGVSSNMMTTEGPLDYSSLCGTPRMTVTEATTHILGFSERSGEIEGYVDFTEQNSNILLIQGEVRGLTPGYHAIKIEEFGNLNGGCSSTGNFFNNRNSSSTTGGQSTDSKRYSGDLENIRAGSNGMATFRFSDSQLTLNGEDSIIGRMVVVYEQADDYGSNGRTGVPVIASESLLGNSRIACGVIGIQAESTSNSTSTSASASASAAVVPSVRRPDPASPAGASPVSNPSYNTLTDVTGAGPVLNAGVRSTTTPAITAAMSLFCLCLFIGTL